MDSSFLRYFGKWNKKVIQLIQLQGQFERLHFTIVPENRELVRESSHTEECHAEVVDQPTFITYHW